MKAVMVLALAALASCTTNIYSPSRVVGVMESKRELNQCSYLLASPAKRKGRIREVWIREICNEYLIADSIKHKPNGEIEVVRQILEDKE